MLFLLSLAVGWWQSGRALRPIRRITSTTKEITATDLTRRIALDGPRDELRELAETIDDMLALLSTFATARRSASRSPITVGPG
nr:HAMP domain-containing protein [Allokutzneria sp. NRRL B-24872]